MEGLVATVGDDLSPGGGVAAGRFGEEAACAAPGEGWRGWGGLVEGGGEAW
jgi:hypothetical protein